MISHIGVYVKNIKDSEKFYTPLLEVIGWSIIFSNNLCIAYGKNGVPFFEIYADKPASSPVHIAFECNSNAEVEAFYHKAIKLNATDNGKPGYREYFPGYYACFIIDPNNHNLEGLYFEKTG